MKVNIGKFIYHFGPYQLAEKLCFWAKDVEDEYGFKSKPDWVHDFGEYLSHTPIADLLQWIHDKRKRTIKVKLDRWDIWAGDYHIALMVLPILQDLQKRKHGAPFVDDEDVPIGLRSTSAPPKENEYDVDANHFKRYDYVLNEMIFAFKLHTIDDWDKECWSGVHDLILQEEDDEKYGKVHKLVEGPNHTAKFNKERFDRIDSRRKNGLRLFAKYFYTLSD